jgi:hypothetical protein
MEGANSTSAEMSLTILPILPGHWALSASLRLPFVLACLRAFVKLSSIHLLLVLWLVEPMLIAWLDHRVGLFIVQEGERLLSNCGAKKKGGYSLKFIGLSWTLSGLSKNVPKTASFQRAGWKLQQV